MSRTHKAMLFMLLFAVTSAAVELIGAAEFTRVNTLQIVWTRYATHLLLMLLLFGWREPMAMLKTQRLPLQLGRSMLMLVMPCAWMLGQRFGIPYNEFMPLFWVAPLLVLVFAALLLQERVSKLYWLAALLACAGASLQFHPVMPGQLWHLAFPLAMAASFALYIVLTRALRAEPMRVNLCYTALGVFVVISPLMPVVWVPPSSGDLALLCGVGVVGYLCLYFLDLLAGEAVISVSAPLLAVQALAESAASMLATHHVAGIAVELGFVLVAVAAAFVWFAPPTRKDAYSTQDSSAA